MYVVYYRTKANMVDLRAFKNGDEFSDWLKFAVKYEPIAIVGIYGKDEEFSKANEDYAKFVKLYRTGQIVNN